MENNRQTGADAIVALCELENRHICFKLLYVRWFDRIARMGAYGDCSNAGDQQMLAELEEVVEQLPQYQKQIQKFFELISDVDWAGCDL